MTLIDTILLILAVLCTLGMAAILFLLAKISSEQKGAIRREDLARDMERLERSVSATRREIADDVKSSMESFSLSFRENQKEIFAQQDRRIADLTQHLNRAMDEQGKLIRQLVEGMDQRIGEMNRFQETNARALRETVDGKLKEIREGNEKSLGEIRQSVDEKLQKTLEDRLSRSFQEVSDRLKQVYQGLGEMQTLASGVGDLKKVLSNVKTRGILGEIQLGAILEEILSPEQYETNVATVPGKATRVEFAVRLPGDGERCVYLPIDSKFPIEAYVALQDAYDAANPEEVQASRAQLERSIKSFAKDIHTKYVSPPDTTDFAIMFLPTEGLYAEAVRMGLVETLQRNYKVNLAGPTTMAALLNSLQTGFRTLAIQKRSSEVWEVLGAVRTEFDKFEEALRDAQRKLDMANRGLDQLVGARTRQIQKKLKSVSALPAQRAEELLREDNNAEE